MTKPMKTVLKITMLETEKKEILEASKDFGFPTMSQFVLAIIREWKKHDQLTLARDVIETFEKLHAFEDNNKQFSGMTNEARREIATKTKNKLLALCSDGPT